MNKIILGEGLKHITFGMTMDDIEDQLGEPNVIDKDEESGLEAWHYDDLELSCGFAMPVGGKLISLTASGENMTLEGITLIGVSMEEVTEQLEVFNLGEMEVEDISSPEFPNQQVLTIQDFSINLWFDHDKLCDIQWGPFWDDDTDAPIWPEIK
ncbi:hypothetical protein DMA11_24300 [Marinilabiliaceae bacterium JC017]|nr:hypothetical protein DMA11_24300 [Marinilabiliaceae bacterium JC017]